MTREESIIECFGALKKGLIRNFNVGRVTITKSTITWTALVPWPLRVLPYLAPESVEIPLESIREIRLEKQLWRAWLRLETTSGSYVLRPGQGIFLRDNPAIAMACMDAISCVPVRTDGSSSKTS
jgi:hypothetical protein